VIARDAGNNSQSLPSPGSEKVDQPRFRARAKSSGNEAVSSQLQPHRLERIGELIDRASCTAIVSEKVRDHRLAISAIVSRGFLFTSAFLLMIEL
jgi:hypothetical protein